MLLRFSKEPDAPACLVQEMGDLCLILFFVGEMYKEAWVEIGDDRLCGAPGGVLQVVGVVIPDMGQVGAHQHQIARGKIRDIVADDPFAGAFQNEIQLTKFMEMERGAEMVAIELFDKERLLFLQSYFYQLRLHDSQV
jgi:hypothetical protein